MAKSQWHFLMACGVFSALSVINLSISFSTDYWVTSQAKYDDDSSSVIRNLEASYGLFKGKLDRYFLTTLSRNDLQIICDYGINKCFYSCQQTAANRRDEFERLLNEDVLVSCPESTSRLFSEQMNKTSTETKSNESQSRASAKYEQEFLSAGLWLTTVIFLALTVVFSLLSGLFTLLNIFWNPVQFLVGVSGLYIWNSLAIVACFMTMIFFMSQHLIFITNNIAITDTLRTRAHYSNDFANLGYSFWLLLISIGLHLANIGLIYYRNYLLQKEPKPAALSVNKNDSTIMVY